MKKFEVSYKGNIASLIKNIKINSYEELLNLELRPYELTDYIEVISSDYDESEHRYRDPLALLIMKIADVNFCKFFLSQLVELGYQKHLPEVYNALFERSPEHVKEVLTYAITNHTADELRPLNEDENVNNYATDNIYFFNTKDNDSTLWLSFEPTTIFENIKLLNNHLSLNKEIFPAKNLLEVIERKAETEEAELYIKTLAQYLMDNDLGLDYGVAPQFVCLNHLNDNVEALYNHLYKHNIDLKDDLMIYLARQFKAQKNNESNMDDILHDAKQNNEISFIENKAFAKMLFEKNVFSDEIDTSLESLAKAHFDFILHDKVEFNEQIVSLIKPSESLVAYLSNLENSDKKKLINVLAKSDQENMKEFLNTTYCAVLEELLFENHPRNLNISSTINTFKSTDEKKELAKEILTHLASLNIGFQERVNEILEVKLSNMNEKTQKEYFEIFLSTTNKASSKIKI